VNRSDFDVVVVGGRVAGAATALLLSRAGARVAVLERGRPGTDTVSTHALMRAGVLQLSRWGVLPAVVAAGTPPVRRTTFHQGGADVGISIRPSAGVDALYAPRRHLLDRLLLDAAAEAGADVAHETPVTGLLRDRDGRVRGVRALHRGHPVEVRAGLTVGADGVRSLVAREVQAPVLQQGRQAGAVLYRYVRGLAADGYEWAYGDHAAAGLIPTDDGETCVFVATTPQRLRSLRRSGAGTAFGTLLTAVHPPTAERVAAGTAADRLRGWAGVPGFVRRAWGPGWALVGDAGYYKDPITTHGITDAFLGADLLAGAVLSAASGVPERVALAGYQTTRDRLSRDLFSVTEEVAAYDWDDAGVEPLLRRVSAAMSDEVDFLAGRPEDAGHGRHRDRDRAPDLSGRIRPDTAAIPG
jgi:flavin-dependent dehydrogenase